MTQADRRHAADTITDDELDQLYAELDELAADNLALRKILLRGGHEPRADRYKAAWRSARQRAQALGEGVLRHVEDRDFWKRLAKGAQDEALRRNDERDAIKRAHVALAKQAGKDQAAIERVTSLVRHYEHWGAKGWQPYSAKPSQVAREFRAALDEHQEQP